MDSVAEIEHHGDNDERSTQEGEEDDLESGWCAVEGPGGREMGC